MIDFYGATALFLWAGGIVTYLAICVFVAKFCALSGTRTRRR